MEDIRYAVIHANNVMAGWPFDTMEEADWVAEELNSIHGAGTHFVRPIDKREADLRSAARLQFLVRHYHKRVVHYMEAASEWGDAWPFDRDSNLEIARIYQRVRAVYARRAMEMMGIIDPD